MLEPIPRAKYPDLTEEEERISLPLQVLCLAIFDAVLVHILHSISPGSWQKVKQALNNALYKNRSAACLSILERSYSDCDVVFLQVRPSLAPTPISTPRCPARATSSPCTEPCPWSALTRC